MDRRHFGGAALGAALGAWPALRAFAKPRSTHENLGDDDAARWSAIEAGVSGRLGVAVLDAGTGALSGHRLDERFPMCSTFKSLVAAQVLARVDARRERLDRRL